MAPCPLLETVVWHDLFLGRPRSRRYPKFKFNIRRDIPLAGVLMLLVYNVIAPGVGQSSASGVAIAFLIGQAYLVAKLVLRLTFYAGEIVLFDGVRH